VVDATAVLLVVEVSIDVVATIPVADTVVADFARTVNVTTAEAPAGSSPIVQVTERRPVHVPCVLETLTDAVPVGTAWV
jgi:hypothetical protein